MKPAKTPKGYGQYCPLALATELLCNRWTILVVSRLMDGCTTFNEIHRGVPRISPSLLSTRLSELEHAKLITRETKTKDSKPTYALTQAGWDLEDVVMGLAVWGQHWARDMDSDDLDPGFLAWSMHLRMNTAAMPEGRIVLQFEFSGAPADCRRFWLLKEDDNIDMCFKNPGYETDLLIESDLRVFVEAWRGIRNLRTEIRRSRIRLTGLQSHKKSFPDWLLLSAIAPHERKRPGREYKTSRRAKQ